MEVICQGNSNYMMMPHEQKSFEDSTVCRQMEPNLCMKDDDCPNSDDPSTYMELRSLVEEGLAPVACSAEKRHNMPQL